MDFKHHFRKRWRCIEFTPLCHQLSITDCLVKAMTIIVRICPLITLVYCFLGQKTFGFVVWRQHARVGLFFVWHQSCWSSKIAVCAGTTWLMRVLSGQSLAVDRLCVFVSYSRIVIFNFETVVLTWEWRLGKTWLFAAKWSKRGRSHGEGLGLQHPGLFFVFVNVR